MPFAVYKDILKSVEDIFAKDFAKGSPFTLEVNADIPGAPSSLTATSTHDLKAGSKLGNTLSVDYAGPGGFKLDKMEFDPSEEGSYNVETSISEVMDGLKLEFKGNDANKADLSLEYKHDMATVCAAVDATDFKSFSASVSTGFDSIKAGVSAAFKNGGSPNVAAALSYSAPKMTFGANLTNNFADIKGMFSMAIDKDITVASNLTYGTAKKNVGANFAAVYKMGKTTYKAKADMDKNVNFSVKSACAKGLTVTAWTKVANLSPKSATVGAKVVLG